MSAFDIYRKIQSQNNSRGLFSCGSNRYGQLGLGDDKAEPNIFTPIKMNGKWKAISCGKYSHSYAINESGQLYSCGSNAHQALGLGLDLSESRTTFTRVGEASNWVHVQGCSEYGVFAINEEGDVYTAGSVNEKGGGVFTKHEGISNCIAAAHNRNYVGGCFYFIVGNGELYSYGSNFYGELGLGGTVVGTWNHEPYRVGTASNWKAISAGFRHAIALNKNGELYGTGDNYHGVLGLGDNDDRNTFTRIGTASNWVSVYCCDSVTTAINSNGELYITGSTVGRFGFDNTNSFNVLTKIGTAKNWKFACVNYSKLFAINTLGELYGAGDNYSGVLGLGDTTARYTLTRIGTASNWKAAACGEGFSLAITD